MEDKRPAISDLARLVMFNEKKRRERKIPQDIRSYVAASPKSAQEIADLLGIPRKKVNDIRRQRARKPSEHTNPGSDQRPHQDFDGMAGVFGSDSSQ